jgi:hypothetical protein
MTANELAEKLTDCLGKEERWEVRSLASNMLRQQAERIEELEKHLQVFVNLKNQFQPQTMKDCEKLWSLNE